MSMLEYIYYNSIVSEHFIKGLTRLLFLLQSKLLGLLVVVVVIVAVMLVMRNSYRKKILNV